MLLGSSVSLSLASFKWGMPRYPVLLSLTLLTARFCEFSIVLHREVLEKSLE